jgi:hypothetical protein
MKGATLYTVSLRVVVVVLVVVLLVAVPAAARSSARNGLVAIASVPRSNRSEIRLFTSDLRPRRAVAVQPFVDLPRFSPDGRWLAFWAGHDPDRSVPWIAGADGLNARPLVPVPDAREPTDEYWGPPIWAPNSRALAYADEQATGLTRIHIVGLDGRSNRVLSISGWRGSTPPVSFALVDWRGQRMLLQSHASGRQFVLDQQRHVITLLPGVDALSPNGRWIASSDAGKLSVIDLTTQRRRRIPTIAAVKSAPSWSPDGLLLAVKLNHAIEVVALKGSSIARDLIRGVAETNLVWSPDDQYLLTDTPAVVSIRSRTVLPLQHLLTSTDYGSPVDWQPR